MTIARVLTIAGSAAQGSAGIQADLKTFQERDVYGMSVITAIVAKNPVTKESIFTNSLAAIEAQYYTATENVGVDALKTGMLFSKEIIESAAKLIKTSNVRSVVVDPVMIGKMGSQLLKDEAIEAMKEQLFPLATVITPNLLEAARLVGKKEIKNIDEMKQAAVNLYELGPNYVLVKGGALKEGPAVDVLYDGASFIELKEERIETIHTSGAGCTYSAVIAAEFAKGNGVQYAVEIAKDFVTQAIRHALSFDKGIGSTYHAALRKYGSNAKK